MILTFDSASAKDCVYMLKLTSATVIAAAMANTIPIIAPRRVPILKKPKYYFIDLSFCFGTDWVIEDQTAS